MPSRVGRSVGTSMKWIELSHAKNSAVVDGVIRGMWVVTPLLFPWPGSRGWCWGTTERRHGPWELPQC